MSFQFFCLSFFNKFFKTFFLSLFVFIEAIFLLFKLSKDIEFFISELVHPHFIITLFLMMHREVVSAGENHWSINYISAFNIILVSLVIFLSPDLDHWSIKFHTAIDFNSHLFFGVFVSKHKVVNIMVEHSCMMIIGVNSEFDVVVVNFFFWGDGSFFHVGEGFALVK